MPIRKEEGRSEDNLIAYTRVKYIATHDETWLVRLAMVKSGIRAMDAMQQFLATADGGGLKIEHFVVAGGSKRGWTTWLDWHGRQSRGRDRADGDRRAQFRSDHAPPLRGLRVFLAGLERLRPPQDLSRQGGHARVS